MTGPRRGAWRVLQGSVPGSNSPALGGEQLVSLGSSKDLEVHPDLMVLNLLTV